MEAIATPQSKIFEAAVLFARTEGKVPAPETAHAIRGAIDEALAAKETGEEKVILFNYSGHGFLDLAAYDAYNHHELVDD
jgi:tryptophan synthase beta chain